MDVFVGVVRCSLTIRWVFRKDFMQKPKYSFYINNFGQVHIQRSNILISTKISRQPLQFDIKNWQRYFCATSKYIHIIVCKSAGSRNQVSKNSQLSMILSSVPCWRNWWRLNPQKYCKVVISYLHALYWSERFQLGELPRQGGSNKTTWRTEN